MIYDGLQAIGRYRGLFKGLDVLIDWLEENDPASLPLGTTEIDGERVLANVMSTATRREEDASFEVHERYMDVQIDLDGAECFKTTPGPVVAPDGDGPAGEGLCALAPGNADTLAGSLAGGRFAIFLVGEPHMPNLAPEGAAPAALRKICFKVLADRFWDAA